jgi:two-component system, cell cycle sensor histidine kinase and response regulator CckA
MEDHQKPKSQLLEELAGLRRRVSDLERENALISQKDPASADERSRQSELERYRVFFESIEDGCFEVDLDGTLTFVNDGMCRIQGYCFEELIGMNHREFSSPQEAKSVFAVFNKVFRSGRPSQMVEYSIIQKNGAVRNLEISASLIRDAHGAPVGFRGITRDRSAKKVKERELERYRTFVEEVQEGCFEVNLQGSFTFCNAAACRVFGYPAEQFIGMNYRSFTDPETARRIYHIFNQVYRTGRASEIRDYEISHPGGQRRCLDMTAYLIRDAEGRGAGFRGICRDVTERKEREAENERLVALLNQARRLEAIATLAAGVAHNFNNLLMSIQGFVSLMFMDTSPDQAHYPRLKIIESLIQRGSVLTSQLLGYARHGRAASKPHDIKQILESALSRFKNGNAAICVFQTVPDSVWSVAADRDQIDSVFMNLFVNAGEAMPDGGALYIAAENFLPQKRFLDFHGIGPGPYVKITIRDTGIGMDQATRERIFEPFFSTKDISKGAGLGLASAYGVIKNHGGLILVESQPHKGSTFTIFLPAVCLPSQEDARDATRSAEAGHTILLADDETVLSDLYAKIIRKLGYNIISAHNGKEALALFRVHKEHIDLAILDMVMPDLSGDQVADAMRELVPDLKIILISGNPETEVVQRAMRDTRQAFLQKPLQADSLGKAIRQLIEL